MRPAPIRIERAVLCRFDNLGGATSHLRNRQLVSDRKYVAQNSHQTHQYSFPAGVLADIIILEPACGRSPSEWAGRTVAIFSGAATVGYDLEFIDRRYYANRAHGSKHEPRRKLIPQARWLRQKSINVMNRPVPGEFLIQADVPDTLDANAGSAMPWGGWLGVECVGLDRRLLGEMR
jgi:hypothetical protein